MKQVRSSRRVSSGHLLIGLGYLLICLAAVALWAAHHIDAEFAAIGITLAFPYPQLAALAEPFTAERKALAPVLAALLVIRLPIGIFWIGWLVLFRLLAH